MADRTEYYREYWSRPDVIAANRAKAKLAYSDKKLKTTAKRLQEHSIQELLEIAKKRCDEKGLNWEINKNKILEVLEILQ